MTLEEAKKIAFREPVELEDKIIIDIFPNYVDGSHILEFDKDNK